MPRKKKVEEKPHQIEIIKIHDTAPKDSAANAEIAKMELSQIKETPGWQRIVQYYKEKIEVLEQSMWKEGKKKTRREIISLIDRRNMCTQFINTPDILMGGIEMNLNVKKIELDPFDKPKTYEQVAKEFLG